MADVLALIALLGWGAVILYGFVWIVFVIGAWLNDIHTRQ